MIEKYTVRENYSVKQAIEKMESEHIKAVVIVDEHFKVLGLFSNGDMRSYFLKGGDLMSCITTAMNNKPKLYLSQNEILEERQLFTRVIYPIVDSENVLIEIVDYDRNSLEKSKSSILKNVPLVIMAGGKGTRLYPYTKILPKPLIPIGDITITERIINSFVKYGCDSIFMILNHKASMIKAYMNDIDKDYQIDYCEEKLFCGTAGGLKLLEGKIEGTFFLSNCDTLIDADLECIYKTHKKCKNKITFVCAMKDFIIPYGVVETSIDGSIVSISEKPDYSFLINTGIYVIDSDVLKEIKSDEFIHITDLAIRLINKGFRVGVFPISEKSYMDMGQFNEMENMLQNLGIK